MTVPNQIIKISQLPNATALNPEDLLQVVQDGDNKKFPVSLLGNIGIGSGYSGFSGYSGSSLSSVTSTGSTISRSIADRFAEVLNVKDYGAIGDGASHPLDSAKAISFNTLYGSYGLSVSVGDEEDWAAIFACLLKASVTATPVYIPTGTYILNKKLTLNWNPGISPFFPAFTKIYGDGYNTILKFSNTEQGRGSLELLGHDNGYAVNMECSDFRIIQDATCHKYSFCMRAGDCWNGLHCFRLSFEGAQSLSLKVANSSSYAQLCTKFEQCRFWSNRSSLWYANDSDSDQFAIQYEGSGERWDNVRFESCTIGGLCQIQAFIAEFQNCQFSTNPARPLSEGRGFNFGMNAVLYIGACNFTSCYFEDYSYAIYAATFTGDIRKITIDDCHFSGVTNYPAQDKVKAAISVSIGENGPFGEVQIRNCDFGDSYHSEASIIGNGVTINESGSYNITSPNTPITRELNFCSWKYEDILLNEFAVPSTTESTNYALSSFSKLAVTSTDLNSINTNGGVSAGSILSPFITATRVASGSGHESLWGFALTLPDASNTVFFGQASSNYVDGGGLTWIKNNDTFLALPDPWVYRLGFGVDVNNWYSFDKNQFYTPYQTISSSFFTTHRYSTGNTLGGLWYQKVENPQASDAWLSGWSSTAYTSGGFLTWLGNDQPFMYLPSGKSLNIGFGVVAQTPISISSSGITAPNLTALTTVSSPFHIGNRIGSGNGAESIWGYSLITPDGGNASFFGQASSNYVDGGGLTWLANNDVFLSLPQTWVYRLGFGVGVNNWYSFDQNQMYTPFQTISAPAFDVHRYGNGSTPGGLWYQKIENPTATDGWFSGWTSTTYTSGGFISWLGNDQPFMSIPAGKSLNIGFGTGAQSPIIVTSAGISATNLTAYTTISSPFHIANRIGSGNVAESIWGYSLITPDASNASFFGQASSNYVDGGGLTWLANNDTFLSLPSTFTYKIGFGTGLNNWYSFDQNQLYTPFQTISSSFFNVHRYASGTLNGSLWYQKIENPTATDGWFSGWSSTTYTSGGFISWLGNDQPFMSIPAGKSIKIGFGPSTQTPVELSAGHIQSPGGFIASSSDLTNIGTVPQWIKFTISHTALQFALTNPSIVIFQLPAKHAIHNTSLKTISSFAGPGITGYSVTVGGSKGVAAWASTYDVLAAVTTTNFSFSNSSGMEDFVNPVNVTLNGTVIGANSNVSTAGSLEICFLISRLPP